MNIRLKNGFRFAEKYWKKTTTNSFIVYIVTHTSSAILFGLICVLFMKQRQTVFSNSLHKNNKTSQGPKSEK